MLSAVLGSVAVAAPAALALDGVDTVVLFTVVLVVVIVLGSVEKVGVASDPKRVGPASKNLEYG